MKRIFYCFLLLLLIQKGTTQTSLVSNDLELLRNTSFSSQDTTKYYSGNLNNQKMMQSPSKGIVGRINPLVWAAKGSMWVYQNILSPQLSRECPYEITCSNFSKQSIQQFGLLKGILISADRLMRCNPFSLSRVDDDKIDNNTQKIIDFPMWYK